SRLAGAFREKARNAEPLPKGARGLTTWKTVQSRLKNDPGHNLNRTRVAGEKLIVLTEGCVARNEEIAANRICLVWRNIADIAADELRMVKQIEELSANLKTARLA